MCCFVSQNNCKGMKENLQRRGDAFFDILVSKDIKKAEEPRPSLCFNTFRNCKVTEFK